jgi:hypothetical protein
MGMRVQREETFAALLPTELSARTGRNIELYNEGMPWRPPHVLATHFNEVLAAKPDLILWVLVPSDAWNPVLPLTQQEAPQNLPAPTSGMGRLRSALKQLKAELSSHSGMLFRHFLYVSQSQTINSYLAEKPDAPYVRKIHGPEFLRVAPSPEWQGHLAGLDKDISEIERQARVAGVPLLATMLPERAQAAMISSGQWPDEFDPFKLDNELNSMIVTNGGTYLDVLPEFRKLPNSEQDFFVFEGHPNAQGHAIISELLVNKLTSGVVPALRATDSQKVEVGQGR